MTEFERSFGTVDDPGGAPFDQVAVGVAELDPSGRWLHLNRHLRDLLGYSPDAEPPAVLDDLTHPDDRDVALTNVELMAMGAVEVCRQERRLRRRDGSFLWVESVTRAAREDGSAGRLRVVVHDISRYKALEVRQAMLLGELAHRGRNVFTILQSVARHSLSGDRSPSEAYGAFQGRLKALSESFDSLLHADFEGMRLDALVRTELNALGARAMLGGPPVLLKPNAAQTLALILHELATNSIKYGALSTIAGRVAATWTVTGSGDAARFLFEWIEAEGPPAAPPSRRGFGTFLTTDVAGANFDCEPQSLQGPDGFEFRFDAPLARVGALVVESPVRRRIKEPIICALFDDWMSEKSRVGGLAKFANFDWARFAATGAMTLGTVKVDGSLEIMRVGRALIERLGRPLSEEELEGTSPEGLRGLYRRCARKAAPCHEYLRMNFGADEPFTLERLIVPFGETPDGPVSHLMGIAIFTGSTHEALSHP